MFRRVMSKPCVVKLCVMRVWGLWNAKPLATVVAAMCLGIALIVAAAIH